MAKLIAFIIYSIMVIVWLIKSRHAVKARRIELQKAAGKTSDEVSVAGIVWGKIFTLILFIAPAALITWLSSVGLALVILIPVNIFLFLCFIVGSKEKETPDNKTKE